MPIRRAHLLWAISGAWSSLPGVRAEAVAATTAGPSSTPPPLPSASICPSRTINYITETLPQQCLRTDWSSNATTAEPQYGFIIITTGEADQSPTIVAQQGGEVSVTSDQSNIDRNTSTETASDSATTPDVASTAAADPSSTSAAAEPTAEEEADPLLDAANFVSFEEWKAKMLEKAGQSPENVGAGQKDGTSQEERQQAGAIHQALDSLGDDGEIELDFGGFVDPDTVASALPSAKLSAAEEIPEAEPEAVAAGVSRRSKNAGTTSKERFNFALFDCSATVRKTNPECTGANYILSENKDSYMLNPCSVKNKFFIVELCDEILIDTIALANYEFFSSTFRQIRFSISDLYPVKLDKWRELGTFESQNRRGVQAFLIENGLIWGRYLRVEFLGHYGSEYYCPVSLIRVHGTTMMDDYRNGIKTAKAEEEVESGPVAEGEKGAEQVDQSQQQPDGGPNAAAEDRSKGIGATPTQTNATELLDNSMGVPVAASNASSHHKHISHLPNCHGPGDFSDSCPRTNYFSPLLEQFELFTSSCRSTDRFCNMELTEKITAVGRAAWSTPTPTPPPERTDAKHQSNKTSIEPEAPKIPPSSTSNPPSTLDGSKRPEAGSSHIATAENTASSADAERAKSETNATSSQASPNTKAVSTNSSAHFTPRTPVQPAPAPTPSTQESFFKSVHKRLQLLEANSTLSLQYIEEQSRLLREAFAKVEKRQLSKTSNFLASLNETVLSELREFRTQYDQIWQSTILELSSQREQSVKEAGALSARLAILADEVVWQKRLVYLQFGLILLCVVAFAFLHSPAGSEAQRYLEIPVLRDILTRSPPASTSRYSWMRPRASTGVSVGSDGAGVFDSPPSSPSRPISRLDLSWAQVARKALRTEDENDEPAKPSENDSNDYQPPTPPPEEEVKANGSIEPRPGGNDDGLLEPDPEAFLRRAMSSPTLGREESQADDEDSDLTLPTNPPRVAELAREAEENEGEEEGLGLLTLPEVTITPAVYHK